MALGWLLLISPQRATIDEFNDQTAQQVEANARTTDSIARLRKQLPQLPASKAELAALRVAIPKSADMAGYVLDVSGAALKSGVVLNEVTPAAAMSLGAPADPTSAGATGLPADLTQVPVAIGVAGTYAQANAFVAALEELPRAVLVRSVSLEPQAQGVENPLYTVTVTTAVFYNPSTGAAKPSAAPAPAGSAGADPALATS